MIFFDQFKVPTIKLGKRVAEFMIPIALLKKFVAMHVPFMWLFVLKISFKYSGTRKTPLWQLVFWDETEQLEIHSCKSKMGLRYLKHKLSSTAVQVD